MDLRSQRGRQMYRDEYSFIYTLNGKGLGLGLVVQLLAGQAYKPKRIYRITDERIANVVADNNRT